MNLYMSSQDIYELVTDWLVTSSVVKFLRFVERPCDEYRACKLTTV